MNLKIALAGLALCILGFLLYAIPKAWRNLKALSARTADPMGKDHFIINR
jgi:uncharacterized protein YjeT (DUF2065 family)